MDEVKMRLLFGPVLSEGLDPADVKDRAVLLEEAEAEELSPARRALREVLAGQILDGSPPEVWATAVRLFGLGLDRAAVLNQLSIALGTLVATAMGSESPPDTSAYVAALAELPLPTAEELEDALVAVVRERPGIGADDADLAVLDRLGRGESDELVRGLLDEVSEVLTDEDGPLALLCGDRVVHVDDLTAGIVLTHRLSADERGVGALTVGFDLAGWGRRVELRLPDGADLEAVSAEPGHLAWVGPDGWLDRYAAGSLLAVRVGTDGAVHIDTVDDPPTLDGSLVDRLRAVYDAEVDEPGLPVGAEDLLLGVLVDDHGAFRTAQLPLEELCAAARLERRRNEVAHDEGIWANARRMGRMWQVLDRLESKADQDAALAALTAADEHESDPAALRRVLRGLRDPEVLEVVPDLLLGVDDDPELLEETRSFSERLLAAAAGPAEAAVARWLAAVVAERSGETHVAEAHLHLAVEGDPHWAPALDRLAWYLSDRGDAPGAVRLWRRLGIDAGRNQDLRTVEPFTRAAGPKLGRNDRCWCGSGRKFKQCHLGRAALVALPERVGWLCRKAAAYLERRGGSAGPDVMEYASARAADPDDPDSLADALEDPLVIDVTLLEGGWFDRFLADRGPLLPDDEALLAAAWALVPRTLYEVVETRPGVGLTLHDVGSGDDIAVRERSFSRQAKAGQVICARAVPDGETHQLIGGIFSVTPGTETDVLRMCDDRRGHELCAYVARQHRPPMLVTREGEPMVVCEAIVDVGDAALARKILDARYEAEASDRWVELHALDDQERILRAQLQLAGTRLTVTTHSEPRMDRVLETLRADLPPIEVLRDKRRPFRAGDLPPTPAAAATPPVPVPPEVIEQIQDMQERRWISEHIPALGGLTPVEATADPSRIEQLERLLATFPEPRDGELIAMRPARVRALLGLTETPAL